MSRFYNDLHEQYDINASKELAEKEIILNLDHLTSTDKVEQAVKNLPGVKAAAARLEDKQIKITYLPKKVQLSQITEAIQGEGCQILDRPDL